MDVITATVDARGQSCPGPLVALHKALKHAEQGDLLELLATDPGSTSDVPSLPRKSPAGAALPFLITHAS